MAFPALQGSGPPPSAAPRRGAPPPPYPQNRSRSLGVSWRWSMGGLSQGCPFLPHTFRPLYTLPPWPGHFLASPFASLLEDPSSVSPSGRPPLLELAPCSMPLGPLPPILHWNYHCCCPATPPDFLPLDTQWHIYLPKSHPFSPRC